jgi:hypothetical protein
VYKPWYFEHQEANNKTLKEITRTTRCDITKPNDEVGEKGKEFKQVQQLQDPIIARWNHDHH